MSSFPTGLSSLTRGRLPPVTVASAALTTCTFMSFLVVSLASTTIAPSSTRPSFSWSSMTVARARVSSSSSMRASMFIFSRLASSSPVSSVSELVSICSCRMRVASARRFIS